MDISSTQILAFRSHVRVLENDVDFAQWLEFGEFMELLSTRASIADQKEADALNERDLEVLYDLDVRMTEILSDDDIEQLIRESEDLPVEDWWR